ncbi:MAG: ATP-binding protein [Anaerolineae bacterium]
MARRSSRQQRTSPEVSADLQPCPTAALDDLDGRALDAYRAEVAARRPGSDLDRAETLQLLKRVGAAVEHRGSLVPTLTGVLFFARDPQRFYPSLTLTFLHLAGTEIARQTRDEPLYLDNREFRGRIPDIVEEVWGVLYSKMARRGMIEGVRRMEEPQYPPVAVREALVNAIAHRDYYRVGSFIQARLFADRLEVQSPGGLAGGLTVDNLVYEQYTRNPHIMRLLEDYGYVERRGVGIDQMVQAMRQANLPDPEFEDRETSFWVTLRGDSAQARRAVLVKLGLNDRQIAAIDVMRERGRLTNREYQELYDVSERTALYDLSGLVDAGIALAVSSGRGRRYILRD